MATTNTRRQLAAKRAAVRGFPLTDADLEVAARLCQSAKLSVRLRLRQAGVAGKLIEVDTSATAFDAALSSASENRAQDQIDAVLDLARGPGRAG